MLAYTSDGLVSPKVLPDGDLDSPGKANNPKYSLRIGISSPSLFFYLGDT